jgi:hypothetical protein
MDQSPALTSEKKSKVGIASVFQRHADWLLASNTVDMEPNIRRRNGSPVSKAALEEAVTEPRPTVKPSASRFSPKSSPSAVASTEMSSLRGDDLPDLGVRNIVKHVPG